MRFQFKLKIIVNQMAKIKKLDIFHNWIEMIWIKNIVISKWRLIRNTKKKKNAAAMAALTLNSHIIGLCQTHANETHKKG